MFDPYIASDYLAIAFAIIYILAGVLFCFFGYRIFKVVLGIAGFIFGYYLAANLVSLLAPPLWVVILVGVAGGILLALLSAFIYFLGVFVLGAYFGATIAFVLAGLFGSAFSTSPWMWVMVLILAVAGGVIAVIFHRFMIILSSSFAGAWSIMAGIGSLVYLGSTYQGTVYPYIMLVGWAVLGVVGMIVQFKVTAKKKLAEDRRKAE
ncbi:TMEM198/TM7SF3 family protein [candidate division WOR-3 bacterium]|nr:TMEM198/TM7SF3 family protein [candidate division WOR-3 bacterium]